MNKDDRRGLHEAINGLSRFTVARIVRQHFPKLPAGKALDSAAKAVVRAAHNAVSPKANA